MPWLSKLAALALPFAVAPSGSHPNLPVGDSTTVYPSVRGQAQGAYVVPMSSRASDEQVIVCFDNVDLNKHQSLTVSGSNDSMDYFGQGPNGSGAFCTMPLSGEVQINLNGPGNKNAFEVVSYTTVDDGAANSDALTEENPFGTNARKVVKQLVCGTYDIQSTQCLYDNESSLTEIERAALELSKATGRHIQCSSQGCSYCTAWLISPDYYVTNYHCVSESTTSAYVQLNFRKSCGENFNSGSCSQSAGSLETHYGTAEVFLPQYDLTLMRVTTSGGVPGRSVFFTLEAPSDSVIFNNNYFMIHHSQGCSQQVTFMGPGTMRLGSGGGCCCTSNAPSGFQHSMDGFGGSSGSAVVSQWNDAGTIKYTVSSLHHCGYTACYFGANYQGISVPAREFEALILPYVDLCTVPNCNTCSSTEGECEPSGCNAGTEYVSGQCVPCGANCDACSSGSCTSCAAGSYLNTGSCSACSTFSAQCTACSSAGCSSCSAGNTVSGTGCVSCAVSTGDSRCTSCNGGNCLSCQSGYVLSGGVCVQANCGGCYEDCKSQPCCGDLLCYRVSRSCIRTRRMCLPPGAQFCDGPCTASSGESSTSRGKGKGKAAGKWLAAGAGVVVVAGVAVLAMRRRRQSAAAQNEVLVEAEMEDVMPLEADEE